MARDLDTLLREAVATTPVDTEAVLDRARTIRRRRTAGRAAAALAVVAVLGSGLSLALDTGPVAPIVGSDPAEVEGALAPVLEAEIMDASLPLLRVHVDVDDVPQAPDLGARSQDDDALSAQAVGPDGTWAAIQGRQLVVGVPGAGTTTHAVSTVVAAAVLPDGDVLAALAASNGAPVDRVVHVRDGQATTSVLATRVPQTETSRTVLVQDLDRVAIAVRGETGSWQELELWTAGDGVVTDADLAPAAHDTAAAWELDEGPTSSERGTGLVRGDGLVLEIQRSDRRDAANMATWSDSVVAGRQVRGLGWSDTAGDPVSVVAVVGPRDAAAVVPVRLQPAADGWAELAEPLLSVDGALWLRARDGSAPVRIVPPGGLPGAVEVSDGTTPLPEATVGVAVPARAPVTASTVTVIDHGDTGTVPATMLGGRVLHDAVPDGCCQVASAVAPDGTFALWAETAGPPSRREVVVVTPEGQVQPVSTGTLYGDIDGPSLAFDASGNLWALADRWWSHAGFPDLVVRRPGETSFTSVGHLPLGDLLGSDAGRVHFHVEDDEVALVGATTDAAGREVLAGRVVVAAGGGAVPADQRAAFALPGPTPAITSGTLRPHLSVGTTGADGSASLSGPFLGATVPAMVEHDLQYLGFPHRGDLVGGLVVASGVTDDDGATTVLVSDRLGTTAALVVPGDAAPVTAPDGSLWALVDGRRVVQLLTAEWHPAG